MNKHIGTITTDRRDSDGQLVANVDLKTGGVIVDLPNTLAGFKRDEEILLVAMRRSEADELWCDLSKVAEAGTKEPSDVDEARLWKLIEMFKPDELPEVAQAARV